MLGSAARYRRHTRGRTSTSPSEPSRRSEPGSAWSSSFGIRSGITSSSFKAWWVNSLAFLDLNTYFRWVSGGSFPRSCAMRVQTIVGVALVGGVTALSAQHGHQLEFTGFGTFTRFDPMWNLGDRVGYGGRLGYFLNDYFGLEVG